jgi:hypothetical protein
MAKLADKDDELTVCERERNRLQNIAESNVLFEDQANSSPPQDEDDVMRSDDFDYRASYVFEDDNPPLNPQCDHRSDRSRSPPLRGPPE